MKIFFQNRNKFSSSLFEKIATACEGLVYISETDSPVLPFAGPQTKPDVRGAVLKLTKSRTDQEVDEADFEAFFERLTAIQPWYGDEEKVRAEKFLALEKLLEENLRERKVFRIGRIQVDIYVVGIDKEGHLLGITTKAVET